MSTATAATGPLLRASLRHDGRLLVPWMVLATALSASSVLVYPLIFRNPQDRAGLATAVGGNPALGLIFGPAYDLSTVDGFNAWRSLALGGFLTALGMVLTVTRGTRAQEGTRDRPSCWPRGHGPDQSAHDRRRHGRDRLSADQSRRGLGHRPVRRRSGGLPAARRHVHRYRVDVHGGRRHRRAARLGLAR